MYEKASALDTLGKWTNSHKAIGIIWVQNPYHRKYI